MSRIAAIASAIGLVLLCTSAWAADHGDGPLAWDVTQALLEAPPYAAPAVEMDAFTQPPDPVRPVGQTLLTLVRAETAGTRAQIGAMGTAVDNGDPFAEPGDTVAMDVGFVALLPPEDVFPQSAWYDWVVELDPGASGVEVELGNLQVNDGAGSGLAAFDVSVDAVYRDETTSELLGSARLRYRFAVNPVQGLEFDLVGATPPDASNQFHIQFEVSQTGGAASIAAVEPGEPLFTLTQTGDLLAMSVPLFSPGALAMLTWLLLGGAWWALRR